MTSLAILKFTALFAITVLATVIDTIAGGGGLLVVPAMLLYGMTPAMALGTNKLQASFGCGSAAWQFARQGNIRWHQVAFGVLWCFIGASVGTIMIMHLHPDDLRRLIPWIILIIIAYMVLAKDAGHVTQHARLPPRTFFFVFGTLLGFYDGFFGPGTGSFWVVAMIVLLGWNIKKATMHAKIYHFSSNLFSLLWFMLGGHINYIIGLGLSIAGIIGARIGAALVIRNSTRFIRPCFITMMVILCAVLFYKTYG